MRFGVAPIAAASYATASDGLRGRALNAGPPGVLGHELRGLLPLPCGLDRLVLGLRPDGKLARRLVGLGARLADRTGATSRAMEADRHDRIARNIPPWRPSDAGVSLGAARLLGFPIDPARAQVIAFSCPTLVAIGAKGRAYDIDLMVGLSGDQECGRHIAAVEQVHVGEEIARGSVILDDRTHDTIRGGRRCGHDASHEVRLTLLTSFGEVDLIADPGDAAFGAIAGLGIIG